MNREPEKIQQAKARFGIVGNNPALTRAVWRALKVAPVDISVLVTGESGTGKEFFPQIIHAYSPRKHARYIAVNCAAIPEGTIDSELFGHEKGAFTGAVATRKGYFEEADGGTIFLDEVAELPMTTQARLLRVLETGEFMKVGSSQVQKTNIRVVAATNEDMARAVAEGRFRQDLFYRLSAVQIAVPPLRDRGNDIMLLTRKFAGEFAGKNRTAPVTFSDEAAQALLRYRWPGNVRELRNLVTRICVFEEGKEVTGDEIMEYLPDGAKAYTPVRCADEKRYSDRYEREREMLFNLIFRLQGEIEELRERVDNAPVAEPVAQQPQITSALTRYRPTVNDLILPQPVADVSGNQGVATDANSAPSMSTASVVTDPGTHASASEQPATLPPDDSPALTLEDTERETIRRALLRNQGRRKVTAAELHISERTLYRKIKEFGLE